MVGKLLRIGAVACWTVISTWLCCGAAVGQSYSSIAIIYPGLAQPISDGRGSILAAVDWPGFNRLAAAAASSGTVSTYLDADLNQISRGTFDQPHSPYMTAVSTFTTRLEITGVKPPEVLIDLKVDAFNSISSAADPARVTTSFAIEVANPGPVESIFPMVDGSEVISFPPKLLNTSFPISIRIEINQWLNVDESMLPPTYNINTAARASAFISTLRFLDPADPTKEIRFVPTSVYVYPFDNFDSFERDILLSATRRVIYTNDFPLETVSAYMGLVNQRYTEGAPLRKFEEDLFDFRLATSASEQDGNITRQAAHEMYRKIYRLEARLDELLSRPSKLPQDTLDTVFRAFVGADPFYGRFTPEQPLSLPFPPQASFRLTQEEGNAGVTIVRPGLWGGGTQDVTVLDSRVTVAQENGVFRLMDFATRLSPFMVNGVSSGENRGFVPPGGQVWSSVDLAAGEFVAYAEGVIVNDLYPSSRPIFVFQDIEGFVNFSRGGEVTAFADNEPMIIPGLPPGPVSDRPMAWIATRARFDAASAELRLMENTDNALLPDVSVVLQPEGVFGLGLDNTNEPLIGASVAIDPLKLMNRDAEGTFHFADAAFRLTEGGGTFVSGRFTDVHIDADELLLVADIALDDPTGTLTSPFIEAWRQEGPLGVLLGRLGVIDLLGATNNFTQTGTSQTDFILLSIDISAPTLPGDYNENGAVDAADYIVWRNTVGETGAGLAADGNGNNEIDAGDYDVWRLHFGNTAGNDAPVPVPEPSTLLIALAAVPALLAHPIIRRNLKPARPARYSRYQNS
jgi:hypothetical protein